MRNNSGRDQSMTSNIQVMKRDGRRETIDLEKIHRVIDWASKDLSNVSVSQVELRSHILFYDGITTSTEDDVIEI